MRSGARRAAPVVPTLLAGLALAACTAAAPSVTRVVGQPSTSINVPLQVAACTTRDVCAAFGTSLLNVGPTSTGEFRHASGAWSPLRTPPAPLSFVGSAACTATDCLIGGSSAAGDLLWRFAASPPSVTVATPPPGGAAVEALACAGDACALVDAPSAPGPLRLATTTSAGASWTAPAPIPGSAGWRATGLACATATRCLVALASEPSGASGSAPGPRLLATNDGGVTWAARPLPSGWAGLGSLSCAAGRCDAVATTSSGTRWARADAEGRGWSSRAAGASVSSLACTARGRCVLVGATATGAWVATASGASLSRARLSYVPDALTVAACGRRVCVAVNNSTVAALRP